MMETWNVGMLGLAEWDLFLYRRQESEHKIRPSSAFDSQYSIIPPFHDSIGHMAADITPAGWAKAGPSGLGFFTLLLDDIRKPFNYWLCPKNSELLDKK